MDRHGSESYFVLGEGLLSASNGTAAAAGAAATAVAASAPPVRFSRLGPAGAASAPPFRFSRLGPHGTGKQLGQPNRTRIANAMVVGGGGGSGIPGGVTYLGQFLDHDLAYDKADVMLGANVAATQMPQARSPSLDLDSLYGAGPGDPESARFYEADGLHLKIGETFAEAGLAKKPGFDLPRGAGNTAAKKRRAIIPDKRNDENLVVASTHLAFIRFHNRVVDTLPASVPASQKFARAREIVTKHYQWMVRTDYLPRVCAPGVVNNVFNQGRKAFEVGVPPTQVPTMPIEFSIAAFRLGHSMVRSAYNWNKIFDDGGGTLDLLFLFSGTSGDFAGDPRLPSTWIADFRRLYDFSEAGRADLVVPKAKFNRARRIDTLLVNPLKNLPTGSFGGPAVPFDDPHANLAFRNLARARMVKLATGQQMAAFLRGKGVNVTTLTKAQVRDGRDGADLGHLTKTQRDALVKDTPLWFYVLREAELNAGKLKGVGARIVAETFHRAIEGSTHSIVRDTVFKPTLGPNASTFRMVDLLLFAFNEKKNLLAPLG